MDAKGFQGGREGNTIKGGDGDDKLVQGMWST